MAALHIYTEDLKIASALIKRDEAITRRYLYVKCYPLFKSFFDNYETNCENCIEFINEIYILILTPSQKTGRCQLMNYRGESTLTKWLKTTCLFYCYEQYHRKNRLPIVLPPEKMTDNGDSFLKEMASSEIDFSRMNQGDIEALLNLMPNKRYRNIIRLRYLDQKTNEETAEALGMTMDNYYNKHKLAKAQFERVCRKEEQQHG